MLNQSVDQTLLIRRVGVNVISSELKAVIYLVMRAGLCKKKKQREKEEMKANQNTYDRSFETDENIAFPVLELCIMNTSSDAFSPHSHF